MDTEKTTTYTSYPLLNATYYHVILGNILWGLLIDWLRFIILSACFRLYETSMLWGMGRIVEAQDRGWPCLTLKLISLYSAYMLMLSLQLLSLNDMIKRHGENHISVIQCTCSSKSQSIFNITVQNHSIYITVSRRQFNLNKSFQLGRVNYMEWGGRT